MIEKRVAYVMEKQRWAGVSVANDGEQGRVGFQTDVPKRMSRLRRRIEASVRHGVAGKSALHRRSSGAPPEDRQGVRLSRMRQRAEVYDKEAIKTELARFKKAAATIKPPFAEMFFAEPSPGIIATTMLNAHYIDLRGLSRRHRPRDALRIQVGRRRRPVLQIDAPDLAMERVLLFQDKTEAEYVKIVELHIATLNKALARHPARPRAVAYLLGQLGRPAHLRHRPRAAAAGVLSGQCRRAEHRVRQRAAAARIRGGEEAEDSPTT